MIIQIKKIILETNVVMQDELLQQANLSANRGYIIKGMLEKEKKLANKELTESVIGDVRQKHFNSGIDPQSVKPEAGSLIANIKNSEKNAAKSAAGINQVSTLNTSKGSRQELNEASTILDPVNKPNLKNSHYHQKIKNVDGTRKVLDNGNKYLRVLNQLSNANGPKSYGTNYVTDKTQKARLKD